MAYVPPTYGEDGQVYTDNVRNSLDYVKQAALNAQTAADGLNASVNETATDAAAAKVTANQALDFTRKPTDSAVDTVLADPSSQSSKRLSATYAGIGRPGQRLPVRLTIPTPDGNPSVGHPSVLDFGPEGWNGHRYWMAYTPFPNNPREEPCIVASNDGITWAAPTGLTNPIAPNSEAAALGYSYWADPELVLLADGVTLACYFIAANANTNTAEVFRKTSTDGVMWTATTSMFTLNAYNSMLSPTIVHDGNQYRMWSVNEAASYVVEQRTSADGVAWSAPQTATFSLWSAGFPTPWHLTVRKVGGGYYMLLTSRMPYRLYWATSTDGLAWQPLSKPMPLTGLDWDSRGNYRSTFSVVSADPPLFDAWVTGIDNTGIDINSASWRIALLRSVDPVNLADLDAAATWIPHSAMEASPYNVGGTKGVVGDVWPCWQFPESGNGGVIMAVPGTGYSRYRVEVQFIRGTATGNNVLFSLTTSRQLTDGTTASDVVTETAVTVGSAPTQHSIVGYLDANAADQLVRLRLFRLPADARDTYTDYIGVLGMRLVPVA